jgi:hypothetical protein
MLRHPKSSSSFSGSSSERDTGAYAARLKLEVAGAHGSMLWDQRIIRLFVDDFRRRQETIFVYPGLDLRRDHCRKMPRSVSQPGSSVESSVDSPAKFIFVLGFVSVP